MLIDFHTHIFPDKIAAGAVDLLAKRGGIPSYSDGTEAGLLSSLFSAGVDLSLNLPVLTRPEQFSGTLRFAAEINQKCYTGPRIISFAGVHPNMTDPEGAIYTVKSLGFRGIKIHPDYQGTFFDDERYVRLLSLAKASGLITVTHAGFDCAYPGEEIKCTPTRVLRLLDKIGGYDRLVLAHLGGINLFDEVYGSLAGEDVYLDTAYVLHDLDKSQFLKMLSKHGEDKILFASDSPWRSIAEQVGVLKSYRLDASTEDKIFYQNAKRLLNL